MGKLTKLEVTIIKLNITSIVNVQGREATLVMSRAGKLDRRFGRKRARVLSASVISAPKLASSPPSSAPTLRQLAIIW